MNEVKYSQGMTNVWSDGEKITIYNTSGIKWVKDNIERIFGIGEWTKLQEAIYFEIDHLRDPTNRIRKYECCSGYIPQRVIDDLREQPQEVEEKLSEDILKQNALDALKDV